ncbi:hypothetical protein POKO110462_16690 [Pontibacter korlensis]|uniref:Uncharacterized protein n=1 Tax=Pontibacter korlensis TaxID=400092 RepID=A0A0E3ZDR8_9BACT|nr:hypothetical protein [Pontibacter korlensis]AKD02465.1 hypothetical protein PKOR_04210 [Pontibacter korlensis]
MRPDFFRAIFELLFERFNRHLGQGRALVRYDPTLIAVSARLVGWSTRTSRALSEGCALAQLDEQGRLFVVGVHYLEREPLAVGQRPPSPSTVTPG